MKNLQNMGDWPMPHGDWPMPYVLEKTGKMSKNQGKERKINENFAKHGRLTNATCFAYL